GDAQQRLMAQPVLQALGELADRLGLIAGRRPVRLQAEPEFVALLESAGPEGLARGFLHRGGGSGWRTRNYRPAARCAPFTRPRASSIIAAVCRSGLFSL